MSADKKPLNKPKPKKMQKMQKKVAENSVAPKKAVTEDWEAQYTALKEKYQFLMAEYSNYQKNQIKKMSQMSRYEGEDLIKKILTRVIDNFDRAIEQDLNEQSIEEFKKGIDLIYKNLKDVLSEVGVREHNSEGELFDANIHAAIDSAPSDKVPPEHVLHVIKKAYFFYDKLLRPAEVIVSQKLEDKDNNE